MAGATDELLSAMDDEPNLNSRTSSIASDESHGTVGSWHSYTGYTGGIPGTCPSPQSAPVPVPALHRDFTVEGDAPRLGVRLRELSHAQFLSAIEVVLDCGREIIQWLRSLVRLAERVLVDREDNLFSTCASKKAYSRPRPPTQFLKYLRSIDLENCRFLHKLIDKIIKMRKKLFYKQDFQCFVQLSLLAEAFVSESEELYDIQLRQISETMAHQAKEYLKMYHRTNVSEMEKSLETELWDQPVPVPVGYQQLLNERFAPKFEPRNLELPHRFRDVGEWKGSTVLLLPSADNSDSEKSYSVVHSVLYILKAIDEYFFFWRHFHSSKALVPQLIYDLLLHFNSKTYALVLGGSAMHFIGFDRVSTQHLCMVSECLEFLVLQIPHIQSSLQLDIESEQSICERFEELDKSFQEHRRDIFNKIVGQMKSSILEACSEFRDAQWTQPEFRSVGMDAESRVQAMRPDECMVAMMERMHNLRTDLLFYLTTKQTERILADAAKIICSQIVSVVGSVYNSDAFVAHKLSANIDLILGKLRTLGCCSDDIEMTLERLLES
eukprot:206871_1